MRIGSLCSGYAGLDQAAEQVTGGRTIWFCEYDAAPSKLLAHRFPHVPNFGDLKALEWADHPVEVLTAGYPCQPFSGAGKRLGTDDPRHLFPWIVQGVERLRPPLLLFENVRGHLSLGFDIVLAELDRIGYDVRWTILRASDIGAPHGRARLWIAARDRSVGGWPRPVAQAVARVIDGVWCDPHDGLFGAEPLPVNKNGSVPMWTTGAMVGGTAWELETSLPAIGGDLLPTPRATRGGSATETRDLLPTPTCSDTNGPGEHGDVGMDLRTAVNLLPTPVTGPNRVSRGALTGTTPGCAAKPGGQWSAPGLEQALEIARGELPREFDSWDEVRGASASLLPTPTAGDAVGARNSTSGRQPDSQHHGGDTLGDLVFDGRLLPTPAARDYKDGEPSPADFRRNSPPVAALLTEPDRLLPTPAVNDMGAGKTIEAWDDWVEAQRAKHGNGNGHGPSLSIEAQRYRDTWGPYAAAIQRWERLTRPAPEPTEPGAKGGRRLSRWFDEWLMGLPSGWITDVPGMTYQQAVKMCGNGVVSQCAAAAFTLLGVADLAEEVAA